ncbi:MAG TPA: peptidyl-prolyl cis-trans isomerase [Thermoanaerobaculia bacterium]|nr:peptidyl-prolyl cis-trans isomerase [Thermoanaerobaculia bacterium]
MVSRRVATLLIATLPVLFACKREPATPPDVIVRVNERMLTLSDFKRYLERNAGTDLAQLTPEVASAMLDQFVDEIIVSEYAASHGVEIPAERITEAVRTEAGITVIEKRDEMRREKLIADLSTEVPEPSDIAVQDYYAQRQNEFRSGEEVRVRQILVADETLANDIVKQLRAGGDFAALSAEHSRAANAKRGGEIGFVSREELPKMFADEILSLKEGEISDVIRTDSTFHIFRVDERRPAGILSPAAAEPLIRARIKEDGIVARLEQIKTRSRQDMSIAVLTRRLPFAYSGALKKEVAE